MLLLACEREGRGKDGEGFKVQERNLKALTGPVAGTVIHRFFVRGGARLKERVARLWRMKQLPS